jgi:ABC-2 type transport system ATP-binding protein
MIKISKLAKSYDKQKVVDNLSLQIKTGEIFGFLGPNGAGKTSTMKMIVGLNKPDSGKVEIGGKTLDKIESRRRIGYMPEDPYFYDHLSAAEFLTFMKELFSRQPTRKNPRSKIQNPKESPNTKYQMPNTPLAQLNDLLAMVGLQDVGKKPIAEFSKGMKQRLGLAQALVNDPDYIFLDEPLDGLDPIGRLEFKKILLDLKKQGKTIFFNSHILADVEEICDQIGIVNQGKLIYSGDIKSFTKGKSLEKRFVETITKK